MDDLQILSKLFEESPLYKKHQLEFGLSNSMELDGTRFSFYCPNDKSNQTFKITIEPSKLGEELTSRQREEFEVYDAGRHDRTPVTIHCSGTCQYCNNYSIQFLIRYDELKDSKLIFKIGQYPAYEISPQKELMAFLTLEDQSNYRKALICRSQSYGIGCFAYLRRIVENEMIRLIERLAEVNDDSNIEGSLTKFRQDHNMTNLITAVYEYLPASLKTLGNNPLKLLYSQLSGGIHEFTDEVCLEKAEATQYLLGFIVKKLNEESNEMKLARESIRKLNS